MDPAGLDPLGKLLRKGGSGGIRKQLLHATEEAAVVPRPLLGEHRSGSAPLSGRNHAQSLLDLSGINHLKLGLLRTSLDLTSHVRSHGGTALLTGLGGNEELRQKPGDKRMLGIVANIVETERKHNAAEDNAARNKSNRLRKKL